MVVYCHIHHPHMCTLSPLLLYQCLFFLFISSSSYLILFYFFFLWYSFINVINFIFFHILFFLFFYFLWSSSCRSCCTTYVMWGSQSLVLHPVAHHLPLPLPLPTCKETAVCYGFILIPLVLIWFFAVFWKRVKLTSAKWRQVNEKISDIWKLFHFFLFQWKDRTSQSEGHISLKEKIMY